MILVGRYRSPFTRRVAVSMRQLGMSYEHRAITAWTHLDDVRTLNPVGRIPALILDGGETLFDSTAIVDYLDQQVAPRDALVPAREPERHQALRVVACGMGALEKVVAALYERTMHPPDKVHAPWIAHNEAQARSAFAWLDALDADSWLWPGRPTQADITVTVLFDFTRIVNPALVAAGSYPRLDALSARCNALPPFADTQPNDPVDRADPGLSA